MRILFAEDEKALSKALTTILERNNYSVDAVFDGRKQKCLGVKAYGL